jgi:hypothetical protein
MSSIDPTMFSPEFRAAINACIDDAHKFGPSSNVWQDNEMRVVGLSRDDTLLFSATMLDLYGEAIDKGDKNAVVAMLEIALSVGVHLERARTDVFLRELGNAEADAD